MDKAMNNRAIDRDLKNAAIDVIKEALAHIDRDALLHFSWTSRAASVIAALEKAEPSHLEGMGAEPVAWIRFTSTGGFEGPLHDCQLDDARKSSGAWSPLYITPPAQAASQNPVAILCREVYADHPEMNTDWQDHNPLVPGSTKHDVRAQSENWELMPVFAHAQAARVPSWEAEAKRAFWTGLEIGAGMGAVAIAPRWDEYIEKRKAEISAAPALSLAEVLHAAAPKEIANAFSDDTAQPETDCAAVELLRRICDMQNKNYGDGSQTHMDLGDLCEEARALLAPAAPGDGE